MKRSEIARGNNTNPIVIPLHNNIGITQVKPINMERVKHNSVRMYILMD